jgi:hypothetical protein
MQKYNKNLIFSVLLLSILVLPSLVFAQVTIISIVNSLATTISYLAGVVAVICWIITGIMFLTAMGDPGKLGTAKKALIFSIVGTAIALLAGSAPGIVCTAVGC